MKRTTKRRLPQRARLIMTSIQLRYSITFFLSFKELLLGRRSKSNLSKHLAILISEFSSLYAIEPRAPRRVRLYLFCGIPFLAKWMHRQGAPDMDTLIAASSLFHHE